MPIERPTLKGGEGPEDAPDIGIVPSSSEPSEPTKTTWEGRDAQLDRSQRQEVASGTPQEIDEESVLYTPVIEESVGSKMVTHLGVTMTREQFEADFPEDALMVDEHPTSVTHFSPDPILEPVPEHPIQEHKHLTIDDLVADDGELDLGQDLADDYLSRSTYVLLPPPPKEPKPTESQSLELDDIVPDGIGLIDETFKTVYESESTYDIGELGSVVLEGAEKLFEKSKKTATEKKIVSHSKLEIDDIDDPEVVLGEQPTDQYESYSTYEVGKPIEGTSEYLAALALSGGVSFLRGAAYTVNPLEWARGAHELTYLSRSRYAQKQFAEHIAEDPLRFTVDLGAGIAGGYAAGKFIKFLYDLPESKEFVKTETPVTRFKKLSKTQRKQYSKTVSDRYSASLKDRIGLTRDESRILHQKMTGWTKLPVIDELGESFAKKSRISSGSPWPKSGTLDFGKVSEMGGRASLILEHDPTRYIYKPIIDTTYGFKKTLLKNPIVSMTKSSIKSTTRMMPDFYSITIPGRSLSLWPFMGASGLISLTDEIPTLDEPIKGYDPEEITKTDEGLDLRTEHKERTMLQEIEEQATEILPDLTDKFEPLKPEPTDPLTILTPIHDQIQDPLIEPGYEPYPQILEPVYEQKQVQRIDPRYETPPPEPVPEEIYDVPFPVHLDLFDPARHQRPRPPRTTPKKTRRSKRPDPFDPMGWEMREYPVPEIEDILGVDLSPKKKKKKKSKKNRKRKKKK